MQYVKEVKRYIDGAGFFLGSERTFTTWVSKANKGLAPLWFINY